METAKNNIEYLNATVWATLGVSKIKGIGVIAIRDIPKGQLITDYSVHDIKNLSLITVKSNEFDKIDPEIRKLILDRTMFRDWQTDFRFYSPNHEQTLQSFMNHSDTPNTDGFYTLVDVKKGEELTEDYRTLVGKDEPNEISKGHHKYLKI